MTDPVLYIVRHGETDLNEADRYRGLLDVPLNEEGRREADKLRRFFCDVPVDSIYSSDLQRARRTAESIAMEHGDMAVDVRSTLRPWDVGGLAGKSKTKETEKIISDHVAHPDKVLPGGESLNEFRERFCGQFEHCWKEALEKGKPIVLVCSASNAHETGNIVNSDIESGSVLPGGIIAVYKTRNGRAMRVLKGRKGDGGFRTS